MFYCCIVSDGMVRGCPVQPERYYEGCLRDRSFEEISGQESGDFYTAENLEFFTAVDNIDDGKFHPKLKNELNDFLNFWLNNLINQGFNNK